MPKFLGQLRVDDCALYEGKRCIVLDLLPTHERTGSGTVLLLLEDGSRREINLDVDDNDYTPIEYLGKGRLTIEFPNDDRSKV